MREHKYKAWDKKYNIMCDVAAINFYYGNVVLKAINTEQLKLFTEFNKQVHIENMDDRLSVPLQEVELLEFTGLHDKNGTEIYEGDILRLWKSVGSNGELRREYYKPLAVEYNPNWCQFVVENKEFKKQRGIWLEFGAFEVIGNIHDNPELMKESE